MKKLCLTATMLLLTACSGVQQRTAEFEQADLNHDGTVVLAEWLRFGGAEASFLAADTTRKGYLDEGEFRQAVRLNDEATGNSTRQLKVLDNQITADIRRALEQSREVNGWNIKVEVYQGNATLSGPVRTPQEKRAAERLASSVQGVNAVFNQLVITQ